MSKNQKPLPQRRNGQLGKIAIPAMVVSLSMCAAWGCARPAVPTASVTVDGVTLKGPPSPVFVIHELEGDKTCSVPLTIANNNSFPVSIAVGRKGCSCYSVEFQGRDASAESAVKIEPGATAPLFVRFEAPAKPSSSKSSFTLLANSDGKPPSELDFQQAVRFVGYEVSPSVVDAEFHATGGKLVRPITIKLFASNQSRLLGASPENHGLPKEVTIGTINAEAPTPFGESLYSRKWRIDLHCSRSDDVLAGVNTRAQLVFGGARQPLPRVTIPVRLAVVEGLSVIPSTHLVSPHSSEDQTRSIVRRSVIRALDSSPFEIVKCRSRGPFVTARATTQGKQTVHIVEIELQPGWHDLAAADARVEVTTSSPVTPELAIDLRVPSVERRSVLSAAETSSVQERGATAANEL